MKALRMCPLVVLVVVGAAQAQQVSPDILLDLTATQSLVIRKVPASDCRVVRGAFGSPVDGSVRSWDYRGVVREYPNTASDGVGYAYNNNDGVHLTLADNDGFDAVVLRGGAKTRLYADTGTLTEPQGIAPLHEFPGGSPVQIARFANRVNQQRVVLFGCENGQIAEVSFYRIDSAKLSDEPATAWSLGQQVTVQPPKSQFAPESIYLAMKERYAETDFRALSLVPSQRAGNPLQLPKGRWVHLLTEPFSLEQGLTALTLDATIPEPVEPFGLSVAVQDPLDPRLDLTWVEVRIVKPGRLHLTLDIPDQVLLQGSQVWLTLGTASDVTLSDPQVRFHFTSRERALPEALAHRKMLLQTFFSLMSEPRPWGGYTKQPREEFYASSPYAKQCPELFMTIDQCHALAPTDSLVRQYREWVYLRNLDRLSDIPPPPEPPAGVPAWAWYPRLAWLEARRIAEWWIDERMVPTGEFGGRVGDDSDMYQQYLDLPFFEDDGVGAQLKDYAARMAELADRQNLREGLNIHSTDALHAYEEGINHLALMARWFYGDPIYLERCMDSARNLVHLTILTPDGRRHFRNKETMGARDMEKPEAPAIDGGSCPLMWHAALQAADYNRNPKAIGLMREWADTWLKFMKPGQWATDIEVLTGKVVGSERDRPLYGGYRSQACVFAWLADLTGDARYLEPFLGYYRKSSAPMPSNGFLGDVYNLGLLDGLDEASLAKLAVESAPLALYVKGDPAPLIQATIGSPQTYTAQVATLYDAIRWPDMYTITHQFTDRVFPSVLEMASVAYLGGFTRRNKFNPTQAVSWEGFGTDYAALVTVNRRDRVKALVYSFANAPKRGNMRVWRLDHGRYELKIGPDANGDQQMDAAERTETLELLRADAIELQLAPKRVTVIELRQIDKLDSILNRADLALTAREIVFEGNELRGVVHNIGAADAPAVSVAVLDRAGNLQARQSLGSLAAPLDLQAKRLPFAIRLPTPPQPGWQLVVDPDRILPEIYEGNNEVPLAEIAAGRDA